MIKKILRNIRQKPKAVREQYAFWIACSLTSVVALIWVVSTMGRFGVVAESEEVATTTTTPDSLSSFMEGTQSQIGSLQQQVQDILPTSQTEETATIDIATPSASSSQTAAAASVSPATTRQEIRIATTSATDTADSNGR